MPERPCYRPFVTNRQALVIAMRAWTLVQIAGVREGADGRA
jgi:hypothetical protein